jgi:hypothetical protein
MDLLISGENPRLKEWADLWMRVRMLERPRLSLRIPSDRLFGWRDTVSHYSFVRLAVNLQHPIRCID